HRFSSFKQREPPYEAARMVGYSVLFQAVYGQARGLFGPVSRTILRESPDVLVPQPADSQDQVSVAGLSPFVAPAPVLVVHGRPLLRVANDDPFFKLFVPRSKPFLLPLG